MKLRIASQECAKRAKNIEFATRRGEALNTLLTRAAEKLRVPSDGLTLLRRVVVVPKSQTMDAIFFVVSKTSADLPTLLDLAREKQANAAADQLATDWFARESDHQVSTLLALRAKLSGDAVVLSSLPLISEVTPEEAKQFVDLSGGASALASALLDKIPHLDEPGFVTVASSVGASERDEFLRSHLSRLSSYSVRGLPDSCARGWGAVELAGPLLSRTAGLSAVTLARIVVAVSVGAQRDALIQVAIPFISPPQAWEARVLIEAAGVNPTGVAKQVTARIDKISAADLAWLASVLTYGVARDRF